MAEPKTPAKDQHFVGEQNFAAQVALAMKVGSVPAIPNPLANGDLDTAVLLDPVKIAAYRQSIADQMNAQRGSHAPRIENLADRIADIQIDTLAQGAGTLQVTIIDPYWSIVNSGFISVSESGYLWPPIDVNFPSGTGCVWRLVQFRPSWSADMGKANVILTFEDRIVSILRHAWAGNTGVRQGDPNQTLSGFFQKLVDAANLTFAPNPPIRFVSMVSPQDPNYVAQRTFAPPHVQAKIQPGQVQTSVQKRLEFLQKHAGKYVGPVASAEQIEAASLKLIERYADAFPSRPWVDSSTNPFTGALK